MNQRLAAFGADTAVILGSGLGALAEAFPQADVLPYMAFPELPLALVPGHAGRFVLATHGEKRLILAQGRSHLYEGHDAKAVTVLVRLLASAGVQNLILTNAAGAINAGFAPGEWMLLTDHLNLTASSPLLGGPHFVDMSAVYDTAWNEKIRREARALNIRLHEGVYAGLIGPQYETPAEIRMLRALGADAVGMSTVLEAIQARALNMKVAAFSCLTNWAAGLSSSNLNHEEVLDTGKKSAAQMVRLLKKVLGDEEN